MSVHTKTHPINYRRSNKRISVRCSMHGKKKSISWREVAKENIKKYTETGLALKGARLRSEMTQKQLADAIGALPHHVSEMEHGKRSIGKEMARKLSKILRMNYRMFL